jgi:hypothetical protein
MLPISRNLYLFPISPKPCQLSLLSEWELPKNVEIRKSIYARITNTRFVDPLFENFAYIKKNHMCSLLFNKIMLI